MNYQIVGKCMGCLEVLPHCRCSYQLAKCFGCNNLLNNCICDTKKHKEFEITRILYKNSTDTSEGLLIKFEDIQEVIRKLKDL